MFLCSSRWNNLVFVYFFMITAGWLRGALAHEMPLIWMWLIERSPSIPAKCNATWSHRPSLPSISGLQWAFELCFRRRWRWASGKFLLTSGPAEQQQDKTGDLSWLTYWTRNHSPLNRDRIETHVYFWVLHFSFWLLLFVWLADWLTGWLMLGWGPHTIMNYII